MCYTGLVPAEYSSGERTRRGHITKAGSEPVRTALTEAAWAYRFGPAIGATLRRRQAAPPPRPWPGPGRRSGGCTPGTSTCCTPGRPPGGGSHRGRPRARRVRLGRDDRLTRMTLTLTPPSRWRTGTLAAAGTIPVRSVNAPATLVRSEGHHPAGTDLRSRPAYMRVAVTAAAATPPRYATPTRPAPRPGHRQPGNPMPWPPDHPGGRHPASRAPAASLRERSAPL